MASCLDSLSLPDSVCYKTLQSLPFSTLNHLDYWKRSFHAHNSQYSTDYGLSHGFHGPHLAWTTSTWPAAVTRTTYINVPTYSITNHGYPWPLVTTQTTGINRVHSGSVDHGGLSRRLNPENEPHLYLRDLAVAQSQGNLATGQWVWGQSLCELRAAAHLPAGPAPQWHVPLSTAAMP